MDKKKLAQKAWQRYRSVLNLSEIARRLDLRRQDVAQWTSVPPVHVTRVSRITGIPIAKLRPKLQETTIHYPWEEEAS